MKYKVISTDDHVVEPRDLWQSRVPERLRERAPKTVIEDDGTEVWYMDNRRVRPVGYSAVADDKHAPRPKTFEEMRPGIYLPADRLKDMALDGVDAEVLYPGVAGLGGQGVLFIQDPEVRLASVRAYNDWLAGDFCAVSPGQLIPNCLVPMWDIDLAVAEARRAVGIGHKGIVFSGAPDGFGLPALPDPHWDPLWAAAQDLDVPIALHIGGGTPTGANLVLNTAPWARSGFASAFVISNNIAIMTNLMLSDIFFKFPRVKFVSVESGMGWVPYLLELLDHQWEEEGLRETTPYKEPPSAVFRRHIYVNFWYEKVGLHARHYVGMDNIMWEADYPHPTGIFPASQRYITDCLGDLPSDEREKILWRNAAALYHLNTNGG